MPAKSATQEHELTMANEDYLEAIYRLAREELANDAPTNAALHEVGVRSVDVAEQLGVSKASVSKALITLKDAGYVEQTHYGRISLTESGAVYAADVWRCHRMLKAFLEADLGVKSAVADREACLMEHALSHDTMIRWIKYLESEGYTIEE